MGTPGINEKEWDGLTGMVDGDVPQPVEKDRPQSPPTLIPETEATSTRPTKGNVAYPFSLKVDGGNRDVNASTATLESMQVGTPAVEEEKRLEAQKDTVAGSEAVERPGVERFVTANVGGLLSGKGKQGGESEERPGVERFETAREDLNMFVDGKKE